MRILLLADVHIGSVKDTSYVYRVITDIFDKEILENNSNVIVFLGDFFDRLFKVNEEYVTLALELMQYLSKICYKTKCKIRFIYGTESHEMNQYKLFKPFLEDPKLDIKVFDTVTEEEIDNKKILYIPEEYIHSKYNHYNDTLYNIDKNYDYIFGHGVIAEGMPMIHYNESDEDNKKEKSVPIFKSGELSSKSKLTIFGHEHERKELENVFYLGSLFRTRFGEETPKSYGIIDKDKFKFIDNMDAYSYRTYEFDSDSDIYANPDILDKELNKIKTENHLLLDGIVEGKIRIIFNLPDSVDLSNTFKENIRNLLGNNSKFSYINHSSIIDSIKEEAVVAEYDFILDKSLPIEDKILRYINKHYDMMISSDELTEIMYNQLRL